MESLGYGLWALFLLCAWSSVIGVLLGRLDWWETAPGASPWRLWGPGILAWSWPLPVVVAMLAIDAWWGVYVLVLVPVVLLAATALTVLEFWRRRAEDLAAGTPRRVKR